MHKIFRTRIIFMCIFTLAHHLLTISASASDLLSSTISSSSLLSSPALPSSSDTAASTGNENVDIATAKSSDALTKAMDLFAIENYVAAKQISIAASLSSSLTPATLYAQPIVTSSSSSPSVSLQPLQYQEKLELRRQTRSLFYSYPYSNLFAGCCAYNNPYSSFFYAFYHPTFYKYWGVFNPYYGYPPVVYG